MRNFIWLLWFGIAIANSVMWLVTYAKTGKVESMVFSQMWVGVAVLIGGVWTVGVGVAG